MIRTLQLLLALVLSTCLNAQSTITQVEYFLDADLGVGANTILNIEDGADVMASITAEIPADIEVGYHKLFVRAKDDMGRWSHTVRKNLEVVAPAVDNAIVSGEYFIDGDPSHSMAISFNVDTQEEDIEQEFMAQIPSDLPIGYHKLFGRIMDAQGRWSHTFRKNLQVVAPHENATIVAIEYFFGADPTFGGSEVLTLEDPTGEVSYIFNVAYDTGEYTFDDVLYVRAQDSNGKWSQTTILDEVDENLGIAVLKGNTFTLYPNPVSGVLHINSKEHTEIQGFQIYDLTGTMVFESQSNDRSHDLGQLSSGMYLLTIKTDKGTASYKIIKK